MEARKIQIGNLDIRINAEPLTQEAFARFGDVVSNPRPDVLPTAFTQHAASLPSNAFSANQGYALQYRNASRIANLYHDAPSAAGSSSAANAKPIMSVFVCSSRPLQPSASSPRRHADFVVRYLERHPFTTQTFTPLASTASLYLVVVAPTLPPSDADADLPVATGQGTTPGRGLPNLKEMRAFVATRSQAVTYGAGTWHSPMVVLGAPGTTLDFVVSQFASGVDVEDCQLLEFESQGKSEPQLKVQVPIPGAPTREKL